MDYKKLTDEQLDEARQAILVEQERRANLAQIRSRFKSLQLSTKRVVATGKH